jgi:hypothetical protein
VNDEDDENWAGPGFTKPYIEHYAEEEDDDAATS